MKVYILQKKDGTILRVYQSKAKANIKAKILRAKFNIPIAITIWEVE